jgi:8-oxo-dGTP pyrophosphatase MutT (NUDIX family)
VFPGSWEIPGGHVDPGETVRGAVVRETREETGLAVGRVAAEFAPLVWFSSKKGEDGASERENVQYNFVVHLSRREGGEEGEPEIRLSEREHSGYRWIGEDEVAGVECNEAMRGVLRNAFAAVDI